MKKHAFQNFLLSIFIFVFLFSCEKQESMVLETAQERQQSNTLVEQVDFESVPEISQALDGLSGKSRIARSYSSKGDSNFWIDESDVLKLKDSVNNESYSIVIHTDDPSPTVFYNLIVTKRTDGNPIVPFVVEYKFENGNTVQSFSQDDEKRFDGKVNIYSLQEFANISGLDSKEDDPVICFQDVGVKDNVVVGNDGSGSSGGGTSGGSSTTGSTSSSPTISVTRTHISVNTTTTGTKGTVSVGQGTFYMPPMTSEKQDQKANVSNKEGEENACPEGWVSVPINEVKEDLPPDCESFQFEKVGNNQFSYVKGIRFLIIDGDGEKHYLRYDNPMEFSTPYMDRFGVVFAAGALAEASAKALKEAMDNTKDFILDSPTYIGEYRAKRYFEDELKRLYPQYIPGGRVQPRPNQQHVSTVTNYKAAWFGTGDCD